MQAATNCTVLHRRLHAHTKGSNLKILNCNNFDFQNHICVVILIPKITKLGHIAGFWTGLFQMLSFMALKRPEPRELVRETPPYRRHALGLRPWAEKLTHWLVYKVSCQLRNYKLTQPTLLQTCLSTFLTI